MRISAKQNLVLAKRLGRIVSYVSIILLITSLIDLFINRLLFRAGPEVISHMPLDAFYLALFGRVSITLEQLLLFFVLAFSIILLVLDGEIIPRILGIVLTSILVCSALLYAPLQIELSWGISSLLVLSMGLAIVGLALYRYKSELRSATVRRIALMSFLLGLVAGFILSLYYRMYLLLGSAGLASLPFPIAAYEAGMYFVMATMIAAFAYALAAPSPGFSMSYRNFVVTAAFPTLVVFPALYGVIRNFFLAQILTLVIAMSTDFVLSHDLLMVVVLLSWFLLTAIFILLIKGHYSENRQLREQAIGIVLITSTTFLFNYPYYLMLGTVGMLLLCYPFRSDARNQVQEQREQPDS